MAVNTVKEKKEKIKIPEIKTPQAEANPYFIEISKHFKRIKFISVLFLVVFILVMTALFRNDITLTNMQYLIRDLDIINTVYSYDTAEKIISYDTDIESAFCIFRNSLAVSSTTEFSLYSTSGSKILSEAHTYKNPALTASSDYLIVYDLGGTAYSVYNMLTELDSDNLAYPISGAAAADNGTYAIVTRSSEYRTVINIYNSDCEKISQILKEKFTTDIGFSDDGSALIISSVYNTDGRLDSEIQICDPYFGTVLHTVVLEDILVAYAKMTKDGFSAVTESDIRFYDISASDAVLRISIPYSGKNPTHSYSDNEYTALFFNKNIVGEVNELMLYDFNGKLVHSLTFEGRIVTSARYENSFFVLCSDRVFKIDIKTGDILAANIEKNPSDICISGDSMYICYYAETMIFDVNECFTDTDSAE